MIMSGHQKKQCFERSKNYYDRAFIKACKTATW